MTIKRKKYTKGIRIKPNAEALELEGEITIDSADNKIKVQLNGVDESVVTEAQTQTLTNKTIAYDNASSGLAATNLQAAVDEVEARVDTAETGLSDHLADTVDSHDASAISNIPAGNLAATDIQGAVNELQSDIDTRALASDLSDHLVDAVDAHDASAISNVASGNLAATDVQGALNELQSDIDTRVIDGGSFTSGSVITPTQLDVKQDTEANLITYAGSASNGQLCFATDSKQMFQVIDLELKPVGGGGSTSFEINQVGHGLTVGSGIYHNGTIYVDAQANAESTLAYHVVTEVLDVDTFIAADFGRIEVLLHGFTIGEYYFQSEVTAGLPVITEPVTGFSNPLFYVEDANTLQIKCLRPSPVGASINIDELADVSVPAPTDNQVLAYDTGNSRWEAKDAVSAAADVTYSNATSGLAAINAQTAIDEVEGRVDTVEADIVTTDNKLTNSVKGDIQVFDTVNTSLPVGLDGTHLVADSTTATGLAYTASLQGKLNPVTDWVDYTPTFTGFGAVTVSNFRYKRVGDSIILQAKFTGEIPTAVTAEISLPTGLVTDSSITANTISAPYVRNTATASNGGLILISPSVSYINLSGVNIFNSAVSDATVPADGTAIVLTGEKVTFTTGQIPIQGWTSGLDAAVQDIQLTAATANELSARIVNAGTATIDSFNYDFIDTVNRASIGRVDVVFNTDIFTETPEINVTIRSLDGTANSVSTSGESSSGFRFTTEIGGVLLDGDVSISVSKQGADVNKSQVIAGTFENINSSDLTQIRLEGNLAETPLTTDGIPFAEVTDLKNEWNTDTFTASSNGRFKLEGSVYFSAVTARNLYLYVDRGSGLTQEKYIQNTTGLASGIVHFSVEIDLLTGDSFEIREESTAGLLTDDDIFHYLTITQSADYEAIVKNLNDNNNFVSQTKTLSVNLTANSSDITDLRFNNLEIGKKYSLSYKTDMFTTDGGGWFTAATHDSNTIISLAQNSGGASFTQTSASDTVLFTATATSVIFNTTQYSAGDGLAGTGDTSGTHATLTELPDNTIINSNKFD